MVERVEIPVAGATLVGDHWMGDGAAVVLLHAGVCDRRSWREVGERLHAAGCDVVAYDRRAFGEVAPADRPFRHVDDLLAVIDAVSPSAPAWLIGSSMGGGVALDAALEAPERVAGLVLRHPRSAATPRSMWWRSTPRRMASPTRSTRRGRRDVEAATGWRCPAVA